MSSKNDVLIGQICTYIPNIGKFAIGRVDINVSRNVHWWQYITHHILLKLRI